MLTRRPSRSSGAVAASPRHVGGAPRHLHRRGVAAARSPHRDPLVSALPRARLAVLRQGDERGPTWSAFASGARPCARHFGRPDNSSRSVAGRRDPGGASSLAGARSRSSRLGRQRCRDRPRRRAPRELDGVGTAGSARWASGIHAVTHRAAAAGGRLGARHVHATRRPQPLVLLLGCDPGGGPALRRPWWGSTVTASLVVALPGAPRDRSFMTRSAVSPRARSRDGPARRTRGVWVFAADRPMPLRWGGARRAGPLVVAAILATGTP